MIPLETTYLKPRKLLALVFLILAVGVFIGYFADHKRNDSVLIGGIFLFIISIVANFLIEKITVTIDNRGISYKNMFREQMIDWDTVQRSYFKFQRRGKIVQKLWIFEGSNSGVRFSTNLFSKRSLQTIAEAVVARSPHAEIDPRIIEMAEGKFPWFKF